MAATELMLLSYSVGSVIGPLVANGFQQQQGLPMYLGLCLTTTCIYMLLSSVRPTVAGCRHCVPEPLLRLRILGRTQALNSALGGQTRYMPSLAGELKLKPNLRYSCGTSAIKVI